MSNTLINSNHRYLPFKYCVGQFIQWLRKNIIETNEQKQIPILKIEFVKIRAEKMPEPNSKFNNILISNDILGLPDTRHTL